MSNPRSAGDAAWSSRARPSSEPVVGNGRDGSGWGEPAAPNGTWPAPARAGAPVDPGRTDSNPGLVLRAVIVRRTQWWKRVRAIVFLVVITALLGGALASALGLIVWGIATGIHHAATN